MIGPTILQGPHHAAQKSTITGLSLFNTVSSKDASVISKAIDCNYLIIGIMLLLICVTKLIFLAYLFDFEVSLYSIHALGLMMRL